MRDEDLTYRIISAAIEVHAYLGPGFYEHVYQYGLAHELNLQGFLVKEQVKAVVQYKGVEISAAYKIDILVNDRIIVEIKSVESLHPVHISQVVTYLKASKLHTGLLINFNVKTLTTGVRRVIND